MAPASHGRLPSNRIRKKQGISFISWRRADRYRYVVSDNGGLTWRSKFPLDVEIGWHLPARLSGSIRFAAPAVIAQMGLRPFTTNSRRDVAEAVRYQRQLCLKEAPKFGTLHKRDTKQAAVCRGDAPARFCEDAQPSAACEALFRAVGDRRIEADERPLRIAELRRSIAPRHHFRLVHNLRLTL
ncbi:hypothetical protein GA0061102_101557 [Rhizobium miluonense]|uniref:Uncharacterized protein n=1 Tax=Rhizobium miluonense TaxID=411945 RepID=A0A1C3VMP0_9HYPH|nr:hypothetical protein GA0061102_101557 [Rhizobium miluonense]